MCILSYIPAGTPVTAQVLEDLRNGGFENPHGHGWAVTAGDHIIIGKSMDLEEALAGFANAHDAHPDGHALFHSRWATHGSKNTDNCHPFVVGNNPLTVVGHNGILPSNAHPKVGDDRSDTRLFADEILCTRYRRLDKPRAFEALSNWAGNHNKLVILTVDPRYRNNAYLVNEHRGEWDGSTGVWHSNSGYLGYSGYVGYASSHYKSTIGRGRAASCAYKSARDSAEVFEEHGGLFSDRYAEDRCGLCQYGYLDEFRYCLDCGSCADCAEAIYDCDCHLSEGDRAKALGNQRDYQGDNWRGDARNEQELAEVRARIQATLDATREANEADRMAEQDVIDFAARRLDAAGICVTD